MADRIGAMKAEHLVDSMVDMRAELTAGWSAASTVVTIVDVTAGLAVDWLPVPISETVDGCWDYKTFEYMTDRMNTEKTERLIGSMVDMKPGLTVD